MISFLRRHRKTLFVGVIAIFLVGTFVGAGAYLFHSNDMSEAVASIGSKKIPYSQFVSRVDQWTDALRARGTDVSDEMAREIKMNTLRDMIVDELLLSAAEDMGLVVTDEELARDISGTPAFQRGGQFAQDLYFAAVRSVFRETPEAYEKSRRRQLRALKVKQLIFHAAKLSPDEIREAYAAQNKGNMKDFDKKRAEFSQEVQRQRALELINYYLKSLVNAHGEIRTYLEQRENGTR